MNEKIEEITRSPEQERLFDARMKMRSDILGEMELHFNDGFEKGIERGAYQTKLETAKRLLGMGLGLKDIAIATGLAEDEIMQLK